MAARTAWAEGPLKRHSTISSSGTRIVSTHCTSSSSALGSCECRLHCTGVDARPVALDEIRVRHGPKLRPAPPGRNGESPRSRRSALAVSLCWRAGAQARSVSAGRDFRYTRERFASTVFSLMNAALAISRFVRPEAASCATRCSVGVSSSRRPPAEARQLVARPRSPQRGADSVADRRRLLECRLRCGLLLRPSLDLPEHEQGSRELERHLSLGLHLDRCFGRTSRCVEVALCRGDQRLRAVTRRDRPRASDQVAPAPRRARSVASHDSSSPQPASASTASGRKNARIGSDGGASSKTSRSGPSAAAAAAGLRGTVRACEGAHRPRRVDEIARALHAGQRGSHVGAAARLVAGVCGSHRRIRVDVANEGIATGEVRELERLVPGGLASGRSPAQERAHWITQSRIGRSASTPCARICARAPRAAAGLGVAARRRWRATRRSTTAEARPARRLCKQARAPGRVRRAPRRARRPGGNRRLPSPRALARGFPGRRVAPRKRVRGRRAGLRLRSRTRC